MSENGNGIGARVAALLIFASLLVAGCGGGGGGGPRAPVWEWRKAGATDDDFTVDDHICEATSIENTPVVQDRQDPVAKRQVKRGCLYKNGWRLYKDGVLQ